MYLACSCMSMHILLSAVWYMHRQPDRLCVFHFAEFCCNGTVVDDPELGQVSSCLLELVLERCALSCLSLSRV